MTQVIRVLIVEDEFLTADTIKDGLEEIGYQISGIVRDAQEALYILEKKETDIAILDINIQGEKDGIWLGNEIKQKYNLPFLFLTTYSDPETMQSAIETKPYSYLVKPFNKTDIYTAIELALTNFTAKPVNQTNQKEAPLLIDDYIFVKKKQLYVKVKLKDILFVHSELKHVQLQLEGEYYIVRYTLSDFLNLLPKNQFVQVHRSYIVNKDKIDAVAPGSVSIAEHKIPLSNSRKEDLIKLLRFI